MATLGQLFSLLALGCSVATCATGVIGLIQTLPQVGDILAWWSSLIVQIYLVLWSLLIVGATAAQFRNSKLLDLFAFLRYRAGLGALLLMNGALAFGTAGNLGLITGGVTMGCGLVGVVSNFVRGGSTTNEPLLPS
jgi:hypothetical protein